MTLRMIAISEQTRKVFAIYPYRNNREDIPSPVSEDLTQISLQLYESNVLKKHEILSLFS